MTRKNDVQYIRLYTDGSSACSVDYSVPEKKKQPKTRLPKPKQEKKILIRLDPVAVCGIAVAAVMFVIMLISCVQLLQTQGQVRATQTRVAHLQTEHVQLQMRYEESYDLNQVEEMAWALGMVPMSQVVHVTLKETMPEETAEPNAWEKITSFLTGLLS